MLAEQGKNKEMQAVLDNQQTAERKNKMLQPIFREIKSQIRHMSFNPEFELMREYLHKRTQLERAISGTKSSEERKVILAGLKKMYAAILAKRQDAIRGSATNRLKTIQKRLEDVFQLLNLWSQYVEVIYMPEYETNMLEAMSQLDVRPEEVAYGAKLESADMEKRLTMLFGDKSQEGAVGGEAEDQDKRAVNEEYETVNEGMTTDTTSGSDHESAILAQAKKEAEPKGASSQPVKRVEEGIQSSDEEEGTDSTRSQLGSNAQQSEATETPDKRTTAWLDDTVKSEKANITSFEDLRKKEKPLYETERDQDKQEH